MSYKALHNEGFSSFLFQWNSQKNLTNQAHHILLLKLFRIFLNSLWTPISISKIQRFLQFSIFVRELYCLKANKMKNIQGICFLLKDHQKKIYNLNLLVKYMGVQFVRLYFDYSMNKSREFKPKKYCFCMNSIQYLSFFKIIYSRFTET